MMNYGQVCTDVVAMRIIIQQNKHHEQIPWDLHPLNLKENFWRVCEVPVSWYTMRSDHDCSTWTIQQDLIHEAGNHWTQRLHFQQSLDCWLCSAPSGCSWATREQSTSISLWSCCPLLFPKGRTGYLWDAKYLSITARGNHLRATHGRFSLGSLEAPGWEVTIGSCNNEMLCLNFRILCFCPNARSSVSLLLQHWNIISTLILLCR